MDWDTESLGGEREEGGEGLSGALIDGWMPCWSQRAISDRAKLINITASFWIKFLNFLSAHCTGTAAGGSRFIQRKTCIRDFKGNISPGRWETDGGMMEEIKRWVCVRERERVKEKLANKAENKHVISVIIKLKSNNVGLRQYPTLLDRPWGCYGNGIKTTLGQQERENTSCQMTA